MALEKKKEIIELPAQLLPPARTTGFVEMDPDLQSGNIPVHKSHYSPNTIPTSRFRLSL